MLCSPSKSSLKLNSMFFCSQHTGKQFNLATALLVITPKPKKNPFEKIRAPPHSAAQSTTQYGNRWMEQVVTYILDGKLCS